MTSKVYKLTNRIEVVFGLILSCIKFTRTVKNDLNPLELKLSLQSTNTSFVESSIYLSVYLSIYLSGGGGGGGGPVPLIS